MEMRLLVITLCFLLAGLCLRRLNKAKTFAQRTLAIILALGAGFLGMGHLIVIGYSYFSPDFGFMYTRQEFGVANCLDLLSDIPLLGIIGGVCFVVGSYCLYLVVKARTRIRQIFAGVGLFIAMCPLAALGLFLGFLLEGKPLIRPSKSEYVRMYRRWYPTISQNDIENMHEWRFGHVTKRAEIAERFRQTSISRYTPAEVKTILEWGYSHAYKECSAEIMRVFEPGMTKEEIFSVLNLGLASPRPFDEIPANGEMYFNNRAIWECGFYVTLKDNRLEAIESYP
jgi:hypothetical protein